MYPFTAWAGRWQPLRLYGPSGATPELGIKHMAKHMREMLRWHEENFLHVTVSDGYEMDVTEFDWQGRERHLLRPGRHQGPPLAALARQGRRIGLPPRLGGRRPLGRVDR